MVVKTIECYTINIKLLIRKDYWDDENLTTNNKIIAEKIQCGLEIPIEQIDIKIMK